MTEREELAQAPRGWPRWLIALWGIAVFGVFVVPYAQLPGLGYLLSTTIVLLLVGLRYRRAALRRAGLGLGPRAIVLSLALLVACWAAFRFVMLDWIANAKGLSLHPWPLDRFARMGLQTLDEEIVLGALPLFALVRRWSRPRLVVIGVALVFAGLHQLMYVYGAIGIPLASTTLASLVAVGILRNAVILLAGHVGYAWALHAAWNLVMFSGTWTLQGESRDLHEPQVLDALVGDPRVLIAASAAAVLVLVLPRWTTHPTASEPLPALADPAGMDEAQGSR